MRNFDVVIYGSYGYTGTLIAKEFQHHQIKVLLSGRDSGKLEQQSLETGYNSVRVDVDDAVELTELASKASLVINCAGPFAFTAKRVVEACLSARTHYTDITGEYQVFEFLSTYDAQAKSQGIVIMPGIGFDVVPTDCLAVFLKNNLPGATHLRLAFAMSKGGMSIGTARTAIEGMGLPGKIRRNNELVDVPLGKLTRKINFGPFVSNALCIPWGDIATAWRSTGIPNIEVYIAVPDKVIRFVKAAQWISWLLRSRTIKNYFLRKVNRGKAGPDTIMLEKGKSFIWGEVMDDSGNIIESRLETSSGYKLTAETSVLISRKILKASRAGFFTPAQYFGPDLILEVSDSKRS